MSNLVQQLHPNLRVACATLERWASSNDTSEHAAFVKVESHRTETQIALREHWLKVLPAAAADFDAYQHDELCVVLAIGKTSRIMPLSDLRTLADSG